MLVKILTAIFVLLNPLALLTVMPSESVLSNNSPWGEWQDSLFSASWLNNPNFLPIRDWGIDDPQVQAKAGLIFDLDKQKILYQKEIDQVLPIASLTKLMTSLVVLENIGLEEIAIVSKKAVAAYGEQGKLMVDERISVKNLLHALLMQSSNDAAVALAEAVEQKTNKNFVELMNQKAEHLGLTKTIFVDPSGYEPANVSTVLEIAMIVDNSFNQPIIWQILKTPVISLASADGKINHYWVNTDQLLNRLPNIIGGKTGYTEEAQGCLVIAFERPDGGRLVSVVLGAQERFLETEKLINWVEQAYRW